jgi:hypothetical protein
MIENSPLTLTTWHIEGHQDNDTTAYLDFRAKQNIQMDNLEKVFCMHHSHSAPVYYPILDEGFQVWLGNRKLSSSPLATFFDHIYMVKQFYCGIHLTTAFWLVTSEASIGKPVRRL